MNQLNKLFQKSTIFLVAFAAILTTLTSAEEDVRAFASELTGMDAELIDISPAPLDGFYLVTLPNLSVIYISEDTRWVIEGELIETVPGDKLTFIRHSDNYKAMLRQQELNDLAIADTIAFAPPFEKAKAVVHVFTDTTCGYCQKLHAEIADYHAQGIEIRYLAYPRAGIGSEPYDAMVSAWCASSPAVAITQLKRGEDIERQTCDNPIEDQYRMGQSFGLRGTPMMVLSNGKTVGGYVEAEALAEILRDEGLL